MTTGKVLKEGPLYTRKVSRWLRQRSWKQRHFQLIERSGAQPVLRCRRTAGGVLKSELVVAPSWVIDTEPAGGETLEACAPRNGVPDDAVRRAKQRWVWGGVRCTVVHGV